LALQNLIDDKIELIKDIYVGTTKRKALIRKDLTYPFSNKNGEFYEIVDKYNSNGLIIERDSFQYLGTRKEYRNYDSRGRIIMRQRPWNNYLVPDDYIEQYKKAYLLESLGLSSDIIIDGMDGMTTVRLDGHPDPDNDSIIRIKNARYLDDMNNWIVVPYHSDELEYILSDCELVFDEKTGEIVKSIFYESTDDGEGKFVNRVGKQVSSTIRVVSPLLSEKNSGKLRTDIGDIYSVLRDIHLDMSFWYRILDCIIEADNFFYPIIDKIDELGRPIYKECIDGNKISKFTFDYDTRNRIENITLDYYKSSLFRPVKFEKDIVTIKYE